MKNTFDVITRIRPPSDPSNKRIAIFLFTIAVIAPVASHAVVLELACEPLTGAEAKYLAIDLTKNKVTSRGQIMEEVTINKNEITFVENLGPTAGKWKHTLSRITGNLAIQPPGSNDLFSPWWKCEKETQKF